MQFNPQNNSQSEQGFRLMCDASPGVILLCPGKTPSSVVAFSVNAAAWQTRRGAHWGIEQPVGSTLISSSIWNAWPTTCFIAECSHNVFLSSDASLSGCVSEQQSSKRFWTASRCGHFMSAVADLCFADWEATFVSKASKQIAYPSDDTSKYECPGCKWHKRKDDPTHLRVGDCKFPNVEPKVWDCPGCKSSKPGTHPSHTLAVAIGQNSRGRFATRT